MTQRVANRGIERAASKAPYCAELSASRLTSLTSAAGNLSGNIVQVEKSVHQNVGDLEEVFTTGIFCSTECTVVEAEKQCKSAFTKVELCETEI